MKATEWVIVWIGPTGAKTRGDYEYTNYETAERWMEYLERQNPYVAFLLYTVDEWEREVECGLA